MKNNAVWTALPLALLLQAATAATACSGAGTSGSSSGASSSSGSGGASNGSSGSQSSSGSGGASNGSSGSQSSSSSGVSSGSSSGSPSSSSSGVSSGSSGTASGSSSGGSSALVIQSLTSTAQRITDPASAMASDATSASIVAIVTDSAGLDTIAGGELLDSTGITYASFGAGANKGTYTATVTWSSATQAAALNFGPAGLQRTLTAKFFDNANNVATATIQVGFFCNPGATGNACDGVCEDFASDQSCGACGNVCSGAECLNQTCKDAAFSCFDLSVLSTAATCQQVCQNMGKTCYNDCPGLVNVAAGDIRSHFQRDRRCPGTHPLECWRLFALAIRDAGRAWSTRSAEAARPE
jgi:hypothetical protein